jgi:prevent-host-death family protein
MEPARGSDKSKSRAVDLFRCNVDNITTFWIDHRVMEKAISAAEANRKFSQLLRDVREGQSYVVTSHGKAVARIDPVQHDRTVASRARASLLRRLASERVLTIGRWKRDELYE